VLHALVRRVAQHLQTTVYYQYQYQY
jgi:hypothetical protein